MQTAHLLHLGDQVKSVFLAFSMGPRINVHLSVSPLVTYYFREGQDGACAQRAMQLQKLEMHETPPRPCSLIHRRRLHGQATCAQARSIVFRLEPVEIIISE